MVASLQEGQSRTQGHSGSLWKTHPPQTQPPGGTALKPQTQPSGTRPGRAVGPDLSPAAAAPVLGGTRSGCQALGTQCTEEQPGFTRHCHHKAALHPLAAAAWPCCGGTRGQTPPRGTGTHTLPCHSPSPSQGDEDIEHFRGTVGGRMGAGRGLTSPRQPVAPITPRTRSHELMAQECTRGCQTEPPPRVGPALGQPWGISPVLDGPRAPQGNTEHISTRCQCLAMS